jgi:hypothetical protein
MQHGQHWHGQDVTGWLVSEKLDGCRGWWTGSEMFSRSGRRIAIPDHWKAKLPAMPLEGEIFGGRGGFAKTVAAVVRGQWAPDVVFIIFDAPEVAGTWDKRMAAVLSGSDAPSRRRYHLNASATRSTWHGCSAASGKAAERD